MKIEKELSYDDICLVPRVVSEINSRSDIEPKVSFCGVDIIPLVASPMLDVCDGQMAGKLYLNGSYGFIHRFNTIEEQEAEYLAAVKIASKRFIFNHEKDSLCCGCALGLKDYIDRFLALYELGCRAFLLDTANGSHKNVFKCIEYLKSCDPNLYIIAGNVCSYECFKSLSDLNIYAVRCCIASGGACSTKIETGVFRKPFSTLKEIWENNESNTLIIADGGIKIPADFVKALIYSNIVMCGGIFVECVESPAEVFRINNQLMKIFRGSASYSTYFSCNNERPKYVEGNEKLVPINGNIESLIKRYSNGLRSAMSYMNAKTLQEFRNNVSWCIL